MNFKKLLKPWNAVCQLNEKELCVYRRVTDEQDDDEEDVWDPENQPREVHLIFFSDFDDEKYL